jgi:hypothetical protein
MRKVRELPEKPSRFSRAFHFLALGSTFFCTVGSVEALQSVLVSASTQLTTELLVWNHAPVAINQTPSQLRVP